LQYYIVRFKRIKISDIIQVNFIHDVLHMLISFCYLLPEFISVVLSRYPRNVI